ncbi:hypothetical protein HZA55_03155 [Candidatus Poribacteria bacterium]|nr:hypothetical protein [Candidatus Poribacteria bacterium]
MAEKTAGKQLQKGFYLIIISMFIVCIVSLSSLLIVQKSLKSTQNSIELITETHQPLIKSAERINALALESELGLMRYIAEYDKDTAIVTAQVKRLSDEVDKATAFVTTQELKDKLMNMSIVIKKIEKTVRMVGSAETWDQKDELVNNSFRLGEKMITAASEIRESTYKDIDKKVGEIRNSNKDSHKTSSIAEIVLILIFLLTIGNTIIIFRWWNRFQESLLEF